MLEISFPTFRRRQLPLISPAWRLFMRRKGRGGNPQQAKSPPEVGAAFLAMVRLALGLAGAA